jgi:RNA polymerase sigma-70 factor (ECF subfamily)
MRREDTTLGGSASRLPETVPDLISRAGAESPETRRRALEELCGRYWKPVYCYIRVRWAKSNEDAKDLTQGFFLALVEGDALSGYVSARASFRTFLKLLLKRFLQDEEKAKERLKRGGGVHVFELDGEQVPWEEMLEDAGSRDPETLFDLAWKESLVSRAVARVRERLLSGDRSDRFRVYEAYELSPGPEEPTYASVAAIFGMKESDVLNHLAAVREEIRKEIRTELAGMTFGALQLEEEWDAFFRA